MKLVAILLVACAFVLERYEINWLAKQIEINDFEIGRLSDEIRVLKIELRKERSKS